MITGLYAGLCGLLFVVLYVRVSQRRLATKIGAGSGGDTVLEQRIRAHANFTENAPLVLILLFLFERGGAEPIYVHAFGASFVLARVLHAEGLSQNLRTFARQVLRLRAHVARDRRTRRCAGRADRIAGILIC